MDDFQLKLCDIQGRLFKLSKDYSSSHFIRSFMVSKTAAYLDMRYHKLQWMGEEYLLEELLSEREIPKDGEKYSPDVLYWIGYLYRYWACTRGESSKKIYRQSPAKTMKQNYLMFHTLDPELAIDNLIELGQQKKNRSKKRMPFD